VNANVIRLWAFTTVAALGFASAGCTEMARQGTSSYTLVIDNLIASSGSTGEEAGTLLSDVFTGGGVINDSATATLRVIAKNPTGPQPSTINAVTITRYRVTFRRTDGRNTPGEDVPYPFDSAVTVTVPAGGSASVGFEFIRHNAKREAPLAALRTSLVKISMVADVSFFGRDQAGKEHMATGHIGVTFGDFADPEEQ
jgi:hypothetical protein